MVFWLSRGPAKMSICLWTLVLLALSLSAAGVLAESDYDPHESTSSSVNGSSATLEEMDRPGVQDGVNEGGLEKDGSGVFLFMGVMEISRSNRNRDQLKVGTVGLVEPHTRLGVCTTIRERILVDGYPVMSWNTQEGERTRIVSWFPVELHFLAFTFHGPGLPRGGFFGSFVGAVDVYCRYSSWANFSHREGGLFGFKYSFGGSYVDAGLGLILQSVALRAGVFFYEIPPSRSLDVRVLEPFKDTTIYVSAGIGFQALASLAVREDLRFGFPPW